jgi:hypothetical protein
MDGIDDEERVERSLLQQEVQKELVEEPEIKQSLQECIDLLHQGTAPSIKFEQKNKETTACLFEKD